jgi:hypothetical protein
MSLDALGADGDSGSKSSGAIHRVEPASRIAVVISAPLASELIKVRPKSDNLALRSSSTRILTFGCVESGKYSSHSMKHDTNPFEVPMGNCLAMQKLEAGGDIQHLEICLSL